MPVFTANAQETKSPESAKFGAMKKRSLHKTNDIFVSPLQNYLHRTTSFTSSSKHLLDDNLMLSSPENDDSKNCQEITLAEDENGVSFTEESFDWEEFIMDALVLEDTLDEGVDEDIHPLFSSTKVGDESLDLGQKQIEGKSDELLWNILEDELLYHLHNR